MPLIISAFASGLLFGLGLIISRMVDPAKVLGFLDIFGNWDPSLALVMGGAVVVSSIGYAVAKRRGFPLLAPRIEVPNRRDLDPRLLTGAGLFGVGWGLVGLCPGPALTALSFGPLPILVFVAAMIAGMILFQALSSDWKQVAFQREASELDG
jgi:uncharacterized membrane protein YedE/YeeE